MGFLGVKWMDSRFLPRTTSQADMADGGEAATLGRVPLMDAQSKPPETSADGPGRRSEPGSWMLRRGAWSRGGGRGLAGLWVPPTPNPPPSHLGGFQKTSPSISTFHLYFRNTKSPSGFFQFLKIGTTAGLSKQWTFVK